MAKRKRKPPQWSANVATLVRTVKDSAYSDRPHYRRILADALEDEGRSIEAAEQREWAGDILTRYVLRRVGRKGEHLIRYWFESRQTLQTDLNHFRLKDDSTQLALGGTWVYSSDPDDPWWGLTVANPQYIKSGQGVVPLSELEVLLYAFTPTLVGAESADDFDQRPLMAATGITGCNLDSVC